MASFLRNIFILISPVKSSPGNDNQLTDENGNIMSKKSCLKSSPTYQKVHITFNEKRNTVKFYKPHSKIEKNSSWKKIMPKKSKKVADLNEPETITMEPDFSSIPVPLFKSTFI